jgi:hypothetical protein
MSEQEQLMDNLLNVDLEITDSVRTLHEGNWDSGTILKLSYVRQSLNFIN